jgi:TusA-related sulfurtransferase
LFGHALSHAGRQDFKAIKELQSGQILKMIATDPGAPPDMEAWSRQTGNELLRSMQEEGKFIFFLERKSRFPPFSIRIRRKFTCQNLIRMPRKRLALISSKGTLDWAYPPFILATAGAAMGWEVGIFFTFFGLTLLKPKLTAAVSPLGQPGHAMKMPFGPEGFQNINWPMPNYHGKCARV